MYLIGEVTFKYWLKNTFVPFANNSSRCNIWVNKRKLLSKKWKINWARHKTLVPHSKVTSMLATQRNWAFPSPAFQCNPLGECPASLIGQRYQALLSPKLKGCLSGSNQLSWQVLKIFELCLSQCKPQHHSSVVPPSQPWEAWRFWTLPSQVQGHNTTLQWWVLASCLGPRGTELHPVRHKALVPHSGSEYLLATWRIWTLPSPVPQCNPSGNIWLALQVTEVPRPALPSPKL